MDEFDIPTLETERLWLRRFRRGDLEAYTELCLDPEVRRGLAWSGPGSPLGASRSLACSYGEWWLSGFGVWAVEEKATAAFLGWIGFNEPPGWPGFELCWALLPRYWGRGFATEGARAALAHGFEDPGLTLTWHRARRHPLMLVRRKKLHDAHLVARDLVVEFRRQVYVNNVNAEEPLKALTFLEHVCFKVVNAFMAEAVRTFLDEAQRDRGLRFDMVGVMRRGLELGGAG